MDVELVSTEGKDYGSSKVIFIAPTVDSSSQTVLVKTLYPNSKNELRADQAVRAPIRLANHRWVWQFQQKLSVKLAASISSLSLKKDGDKLFAKQVEIEVGEIEGRFLSRQKRSKTD